VLLDPPKRRDTLRAQVLLHGKPFPNATVTAHVRDAGGEVRTHRFETNRRGIARVRLHTRGTWMLRLVHMQPCRGCEHADWESFWTSFTFATQ
jgi:uncharacterized GH25 family protein